jgi:hypothetical protein
MITRHIKHVVLVRLTKGKSTGKPLAKMHDFLDCRVAYRTLKVGIHKGYVDLAVLVASK